MIPNSLSKMRGALLACAVVSVATVVACSGGNTAVTAPEVDGGLNCGDSAQACGSTCTVLARDPANCGSCGNTCKAGEVCATGKCATSCGGGSTQCGQSCVSVQTDGANCGACAAACKAGEVCSAGKCGSACAGGSQACGQSCVDTKNDPANCGSCGNACTGGQVCSAGVCGLSCAGGTTNCNGLCINTANDPANCGSCGNACPGGQVCSSGVCGLSCVGGTSKCGGACVDTKNDPSNCGKCGVACSFANAGAFCSNSACTLGACNGNFLNCNKNAADGCEVDISTDVNNCGGCGKVCVGTCAAGVCNAKFVFKPSQIIDGQTVTCSSVNNANPLYTECDDLNQAGLYFPNGITCGPQWSTTNSSYSDTVGFCQSLTGTAKMEAYYNCTGSVTRTTWKNHVWGTTTDNGYTQHVRCYY